MHYETDYRLENFILDTRWENVPEEVKMRMKGCLLDGITELCAFS